MTVSSIRNQQSAIKNPLWIMVVVLLLAAAFRFLAIDSAPPGWRDDELIEYNMDRRIADGWRPLFISEAEGHEPVYHYLHAGTIVLFGDNIIGYKWLPLACGLLSIALTYALARKMFSVKVALLAAALLAVSFWPIMYARFGVRHIGVLPWMLGALYLLYPATPASTLPRFSGEGAQLPRPFRERVRGEGRFVLAGIFLAAALMTYFAGRAVPIILMGFLIYLFIFNRSTLRRVWWRYVLAIGIAVLIALPMFIQIANTPGGEKRTEVVGGPLLELRKGNVRPAIATTLGTLGMFTFAGDPEWLYNVEHRPVFDWITGLFFYLGVVICLVRLKRTESGFALAWLVIGIAPAFVSIPAASFSHTIVALPVVYMLTSYGVIETSVFLGGWIERRRDRGTEGQRDGFSPSHILSISLSLLLVVLGGWLTIRDYFGTWANEYIVRFQYHAPTRDVAQWLRQHPEITDVAIGTNPNELVLDPIALNLDLKRDNVHAQWFSPETALVIPPAGSAVILSVMQPASHDNVEPWLAALENQSVVQRVNTAFTDLSVYFVTPEWQFKPEVGLPVFDQAVSLVGGGPTPATAHPGDKLVIQTIWSASHSVSGSDLKSFVHILNANNQVVVGDDRFDVNAASLLPGDYIGQFSHVTLPPDLALGQYRIEVGLYHPDTGIRLLLPDGGDHVFINPLEVTAP